MVLRGDSPRPSLRAMIQPHLYPKIQVPLGSWLARRRVASSTMDISDGLSTDLARLCAASGRAPKSGRTKYHVVPPATIRKLAKRKLDSLQLALHGGEDYELLFTLPPRHLQNLRNAPGVAALTPIGQITRCQKLSSCEKMAAANH